jgi:hypothetical protein
MDDWDQLLRQVHTIPMLLQVQEYYVLLGNWYSIYIYIKFPVYDLE